MNEKTRKALYVASDLLWRGAVFAGKCGVVLCGLALIPSIIKDAAEKRSKNAGRNNNN